MYTKLKITEKLLLDKSYYLYYTYYNLFTKCYPLDSASNEETSLLI